MSPQAGISILYGLMAVVVVGGVAFIVAIWRDRGGKWRDPSALQPPAPPFSMPTVPLWQWVSLFDVLNENTGAIKKMSTQLDALKAQLAQNTSVIGSAVALIGGLKQQLDDAIASGDVTQLQALSDQLAADDLALAQAVSANTPGGPVVEPPPAEEPTEGGDNTGDEQPAAGDSNPEETTEEPST